MLKRLVYRIWTESREIYGAPKIREELKKMGISIAERTVGAYMHEMGIKACYIKKPFRQKQSDKAFNTSLKNLLYEEFDQEAPNAVWCSDITYICTGEGFVYLTSIMDLFSRKIISWRLSRTMKAEWIAECVKEAKQQRRVTRPLLIHTDRGSQYTSEKYMEAIGKDLTASYSDKASPWQNACIEAFHALIKREWLYRFKIKDYDHAYRLVFSYINAFYNTVRIHGSCGYLSPQQYELKYQKVRKFQLKENLVNLTCTFS